MSERIERLRRLLAIRRSTEELERVAVQGALAAVTEAETALAAADVAFLQAKLNAKAAMAAGQRDARLLACAQEEAAGVDRRKLQKTLAARRRKANTAMAKFLEVRREHEQVNQLVKDADHLARVDEARRSQVSVDEWFLSRRPREL